MAQTAGYTLGLALCDPNEMPVEVRRAMAIRRQALTISEMIALSKDPDPSVRRLLASRRQDLPLEAAENLVSDKDQQVLDSMSVRPEGDAKAWRRYLNKAEEEHREKGLKEGHKYGYWYPKSSRSAEQARTMPREKAAAEIQALLNKGLGWKNEDRAYGFAEHKDPEVRRLAAKVLGTPEPVLKRLSRDPDLRVRAESVLNADFPRRDLRRMSKDGSAHVRAAVVTRAWDPLLVEMADDPSPMVRAAVAARLRPRTEASALFFGDESPRVRAAAAGLWSRGDMDPYVAEKLLTEIDKGDYHVARAIALNHSFSALPESDLAVLAVSRDDGTWIPAQEEIRIRDKIKSDPAQKTRQFKWLVHREEELRDRWPERAKVMMRDTENRYCTATARRNMGLWFMNFRAENPDANQADLDAALKANADVAAASSSRKQRRNKEKRDAIFHAADVKAKATKPKRDKK